MPHPCPIDNCSKLDLPDHLLMCAYHWRMVPKGLQRDVYAAYRRGAGLGTPELASAQGKAIHAVES